MRSAPTRTSLLGFLGPEGSFAALSTTSVGTVCGGRAAFACSGAVIATITEVAMYDTNPDGCHRQGGSVQQCITFDSKVL
jgi:hypothetical protein